jgi:hypothetical protein
MASSAPAAGGCVVAVSGLPVRPSSLSAALHEFLTDRVECGTVLSVAPSAAGEWEITFSTPQAAEECLKKAPQLQSPTQLVQLLLPRLSYRRQDSPTLPPLAVGGIPEMYVLKATGGTFSGFQDVKAKLSQLSLAHPETNEAVLSVLVADDATVAWIRCRSSEKAYFLLQAYRHEAAPESHFSNALLKTVPSLAYPSPSEYLQALKLFADFQKSQVKKRYNETQKRERSHLQ